MLRGLQQRAQTKAIFAGNIPLPARAMWHIGSCFFNQMNRGLPDYDDALLVEARIGLTRLKQFQVLFKLSETPRFSFYKLLESGYVSRG